MPEDLKVVKEGVKKLVLLNESWTKRTLALLRASVIDGSRKSEPRCRSRSPKRGSKEGSAGGLQPCLGNCVDMPYFSSSHWLGKTQIMAWGR